MSYRNYEDVLSQLRVAGLIVKEPLAIGGRRSERCQVEGADKEKRGWYWLHDIQIDGEAYLVGSFGVFRGDDFGTQKIALSKTCEDCGLEMSVGKKSCPGCQSKKTKKRELTPEQQVAIKARLAEDKRRADAEREAEINRAAGWAHAVWLKCRDLTADEHDYIGRKKLASAHGARLFESNDGILLEGSEPDDYKYLARFHGALVVPMCDEIGRPRGLQFILSRARHKEWIANREGRDKEYWPKGMSSAGLYFLIGGRPGQIGMVAEGFATAASLHEASRLPVAVAFSAGNLKATGEAIWKARKKRISILYAADDDWLQKCACCGKATEGAQAVAGQIEAKLAALEWQTAPLPGGGGSALGGAGEGVRRPYDRRRAVAVLELDEAVERFIPLDDGTGKYLFDTWTNKIVHRDQMATLLPAGVRGDDVKRHPLWIERGAYYLDQVGFDPSGKDKNVKLNTWRGWPMEASEGNCGRLLELIWYLCNSEGNGDELSRWLLCWMAYPLQRPGAKMNSAVIMHGPQGTGKSTVFQTLAKIYGDYATVLNQRGLEDKFNSDWSDSKLFILAEEVVTRAEMWHIKNELKELVTGEWIRINPKNIAAYRQRNQVNIAYLSNENQPLPIENDDRRHCVIWTPPELDPEYYVEVFNELENGGVAAFYHYLLNLDISKFNPKTRPPMTAAKLSLIDLSLPSELRFVNEWIGGDTPWPVCPCLAGDLYAAYLKWCRVNGESRPRPSNHFHGAVGRLKGWEKKLCRVYADTFCTGTPEPKRIVIPALEILQKAGCA
ncbi:MAG: DUF5906 domain-containing protein, partial [Proteobacteria bacterium]|nr:DUF5906 domain-containing protein [Pseudomonadota bacterium]